MSLTDEGVPVPLTSGGAPITVSLSPGTYLLIGSISIHGSTAGDTLQIMFLDGTLGLAFGEPAHRIFVNTVALANERRAYQFMQVVEIVRPTKIQMGINCDESRGLVYGGEYGVKYTGIEWVRL